MVHLTIDIGNTATKAALHAVKEAESLAATAPLRHQRVEGSSLKWLRDFIGQDEVTACIVSSTIDVTPAMQRQIDGLGIPYVICLDASTPIPIRNGYETPETLGPFPHFLDDFRWYRKGYAHGVSPVIVFRSTFARSQPPGIQSSLLRRRSDATPASNRFTTGPPYRGSVAPLVLRRRNY